MGTVTGWGGDIPAEAGMEGNTCPAGWFEGVSPLSNTFTPDLRSQLPLVCAHLSGSNPGQEMV